LDSPKNAETVALGALARVLAHPGLSELIRKLSTERADV
jgi:hypothetical protein